MTDEKPPLRILALDLAKTFGWAEWNGVGNPIYGAETLCDRDATRSEVLMAFAKWFATRLTFKPDIVVVEAPMDIATMGRVGTANHSARMLIGLVSIAEMVCAHKGIVGVRYREANVQDVRQFFVGHRTFSETNMGKRAARAKCREIGWEVDSLDAADAIALCVCTFARIETKFFQNTHAAKFVGRLPLGFAAPVKKPKRAKAAGPLFRGSRRAVA